MIAALDNFLKIHSNTRREQLGIWMVRQLPSRHPTADPLHGPIILISDLEYRSSHA